MTFFGTHPLPLLHLTANYCCRLSREAYDATKHTPENQNGKETVSTLLPCMLSFVRVRLDGKGGSIKTIPCTVELGTRED